MIAFITDLYIAMNVYAFAAACVDKQHRGKYKRVFWSFTMGFGAMGSALACFLLRHRTRSGGAAAALLLALVQFFLFKKLVIG